MKLPAILASLFAAVAPATAETLLWDPITTTNHLRYAVYSATNNSVTFGRLETTNAFLLLGNLPGGVTYRYYVASINDALLESEPSLPVVYTKFAALPPINITGRTVSAYNAGRWVNFQLLWQGVTNMSAFGITNYWLNVAPAVNGTNAFNTGIATSFNFPSLDVADYVFSVTATNVAGGSPPGAIYIQSSRPPGRPTGVIVQIDP